MTEDEQQPFSEQAALRELEDLHRAIEASRVRRKDANDAFDRFLRSFDRRPSPVRAPEPPPASRSAPVPPAAAVPAAAAPAMPVAPTAIPPAPVPPAPIAPAVIPPAAVAPTPSPPAVPPAEEVVQPQHIIELTPAKVTPANLEVPTPAFPSERRDLPGEMDLDNWDQPSAAGVSAFPEESDPGRLGARDPAFPSEPRTVPSALAVPVWSRRRIPPAAVAAAVLVIAAVAFFALRGNRDDTGRSDAVAAETPVATPQPAPAPVATPPTPRAEIATLRHVWVRVMVDGQKVIERELPPNTRIPLDPAAQFVVRAGDAGAVRVAIAGKDQGPVGADGRPATKAFTVPPKARE